MGQPRKVIPNLVPEKKEAGTSITCLTRDPMLVVASHLPFNALTALSVTCTGFFHFTKASIDTRKRLLPAVMAANIEMVTACLTNPLNVPMILTQISAKEGNGREWESVSPLEFAAWAGDQELLTLLLQHIPQQDKPEAIKQLEKVVMTGLQHGFPLKPFFELSEVYQIYPLHFANDIRLEAEPFCIKAMGGKQAKLPSFCLQLFCDGERFTSQSNKSDILYLEALGKLKNFGVTHYINKSAVTTYIDRFPTYAEAATYCKNYIVDYMGRHQIFLMQLIDRLRLEVPQPEPATKRTRRK